MKIVSKGEENALVRNAFGQTCQIDALGAEHADNIRLTA